MSDSRLVNLDTFKEVKELKKGKGPMWSSNMFSGMHRVQDSVPETKSFKLNGSKPHTDATDGETHLTMDVFDDDGKKIGKANVRADGTVIAKLKTHGAGTETKVIP